MTDKECGCADYYDGPRKTILIRHLCPIHWNEGRDIYNRDLAKHLIDGHDETRTEDEIFKDLTEKDGLRR